MKENKVDNDNTSDSDYQPTAAEDVARYFPWANLQGSKYRDYSASREKSRADACERNDRERSGVQEVVTLTNVSNNGPKTNIRHRTPSYSTTEQRKLTTMPEGRNAMAQRNARRPMQSESSRWIALKGSLHSRNCRFGDGLPSQELNLPTLVLFSLAGGTGKTTLAAAMGCLLAAEGMSSLLVDTHIYGLLPLFFGARELSPGTSRAFGCANSAPLRILTIDTSNISPLASKHVLVEQIANHADGADRILIDLSTASIALLRNLLPLSPTLLVVLTPDMASVVSLKTVRGAIEQMEEETGKDIQTFFLLNQFDVSLRLHRNMRERFTKQLGKQLLPFAVRRSDALDEALATGMTIVDYAPDSQTVEDLRIVAQWIRELDDGALDATQDLHWRQR